MPMNTTFDTDRPSVPRVKCSTCARISEVVRLRVKPCWPVAQKTQPIAHPACVETHTVERPRVPGACSGLSGS